MKKKKVHHPDQHPWIKLGYNDPMDERYLWCPICGATALQAIGLNCPVTDVRFPKIQP